MRSYPLLIPSRSRIICIQSPCAPAHALCSCQHRAKKVANSWDNSLDNDLEQNPEHCLGIDLDNVVLLCCKGSCWRRCKHEVRSGCRALGRVDGGFWANTLTLSLTSSVFNELTSSVQRL